MGLLIWRDLKMYTEPKLYFQDYSDYKEFENLYPDEDQSFMQAVDSFIMKKTDAGNKMFRTTYSRSISDMEARIRMMSDFNRYFTKLDLSPENCTKYKICKKDQTMTRWIYYSALWGCEWAIAGFLGEFFNSVTDLNMKNNRERFIRNEFYQKFHYGRWKDISAKAEVIHPKNMIDSPLKYPDFKSIKNGDKYIRLYNKYYKFFINHCEAYSNKWFVDFITCSIVRNATKDDIYHLFIDNTIETYPSMESMLRDFERIRNVKITSTYFGLISKLITEHPEIRKYIWEYCKA